MQRLAPPIPTATRERWHLTGQVQGVGFRPFVYRLAQELGVAGLVTNDRDGVRLEVQAGAETLDRLRHALLHDAPPLVRIDSLRRHVVPAEAGAAEFRIVASELPSDATASCEVTVDTAVCPECLAELLDPSDPRHAHPLINCTNCGPRYSIVTAVPYDRPNTTMAAFAMCPRCAAEYADPSDRRFHAQPINCPRCGPQVGLVNAAGKPIAGDPIAVARSLLLDGKILAIKGLGGFHLAVRADRDAGVDELRRRKHRSAKPLAVMVRSHDAARRVVRLSDRGAAALASPAAPIVLCPIREGSCGFVGSLFIAASVAPGMARLGVMLPYTPLQHLLFADPAMPPLVMTSANDSAEPLVYDNSDVLARLAPLCDAILWHNRDIARPVDDSVLVDLPDAPPIPVRRARGYVPASIPLPIESDEPGLCVGGDLKCTVALVQGRRVVLSQHLGDLAHPAALSLMRRTVDDLCRLLRVEPRWVACDLHPDYHGTRFARALADRRKLPLILVQHHHAHAAAVLAEHGVAERALAIVCDGTGFGPDGTIWGGELLRVDGHRFDRLASLTPLPLAGGDTAAKDARRPALALLKQALGDDWADHEAALRLVPDDADRAMLAAMLDGDVRCTPSTGAGRVFDGFAALLGVATANTYEAECAMRLEAAASAAAPTAAPLLPQSTTDAAGVARLDLSPLVRDLLRRQADGEPVDMLARLVHDQFADAWVAAALRFARETRLRTVALSGGVFCNALLTRRVVSSLQLCGLRVLRHTVVPPNDGGLAYGQAAVAVAMRRHERIGVHAT
jgi:hydrogenase maturation protein HypF